MSKPSTAKETCRAMIDQFANETRLRGGGTLIKKQGCYSKAPGHAHFNALVGSLSADRQMVLAEMLENEREAAMHDLLADLDWWSTCREVALTFRGEDLTASVEGEGLHGDFTARAMGDPWAD